MIAFLFPGQGSQTTGMGAALAAACPAAAEVFEQADDLLGFALSRLCFAGPDRELTPTEIAQPALLTCSWAALRSVAETLGEPALVAGHSLGEYTALLAAGALDFPTALRLVRRRGELMRDAAAARPGAMAAVLKLDDQAVAGLCDEADGVVVAANFNAPGQVVVSGEGGAVEAVMAAAKAAGGRAMKLPVSGAFHSPLMQPAAEAMAAELAAADLHDARVPVYQNVTAAPAREAEALRQGLVDQITGSVQWTASVQAMAAAGLTRAVELGPGKVLRGLVGRIAPDLAVYNVAEPADADGLASWLER